jgi:NADH-quinone oxidoreductase subunit J
MNAVFWAASAVAVAATVMVITRQRAVHALLYLVVSLLAAAVIMFVLGAAFVDLEVIIYAGAIMVLFVFVIMLIGPESIRVPPRTWIGPSILGALLLGLLAWALAQGSFATQPATEIGPKQVGMALFGPYIIGAEIAAFLLLAGLVGAFHLGRRISTSERSR